MTPVLKKIAAAVRLLRPLNLIIVILGVLLSGYLAHPDASGWIPIIVTAAAAALIAGGGNAINDHFDIEIDRHNRPDRPLPAGHLQSRDAKLIWGVGSVAGLLLAFTVNQLILSICVFWVSSLFLYSLRYKRRVLTGNLLVSTATALALIAGAGAAGDAMIGLVPAEFAFLATLARELVKDMEDLEGDRRHGARTLPVVFGIRSSQLAATGILLLLVALTIMVVRWRLYSLAFAAIAVVLDAAMIRFIYYLWMDPTRGRFGSISRGLKFVMLGGLAGILLGSLSLP